MVVTGASRGLGFVTALDLSKKGAAVLLLNRDSARAQESLAVIAGACTGPPPRLINCDLLDFASVRAAAAEVSRATAVVAGGLDVLCCNAGVMLQPDEASKDGYDVTASTNVLSHFLLTKLLLPCLERAAERQGEARVVCMSSGSGFGETPFDPRFLEKRGGNLGDLREATKGPTLIRFQTPNESAGKQLSTRVLHCAYKIRKFVLG